MLIDLFFLVSEIYLSILTCYRIKSKTLISSFLMTIYPYGDDSSE